MNIVSMIVGISQNTVLCLFICLSKFLLLICNNFLILISNSIRWLNHKSISGTSSSPYLFSSIYLLPWGALIAIMIHLFCCISQLAISISPCAIFHTFCLFFLHHAFIPNITNPPYFDVILYGFGFFT